MLGQYIPILVAGDFNYIESTQEKRGRKAFMDGVESRMFWGFIEGKGLVDLRFVGLSLFSAIAIIQG